MADIQKPCEGGQAGKSKDKNELKQGVLNKYFNTRQHQFDEQFVEAVFAIAEKDQQIDEIIKQYSLRLLSTRQLSAIPFLQRLFKNPRYQGPAQIFLTQLLQLKTTIQNQPLQFHILNHLPQLLPFLNKSNSQFIRALLAFLSLKMRSFDLQMRITALQSLKSLGVMAARDGGEWARTLSLVVPQMIEKEQLVKEVSYIKGLFLQMLQDEFHEVRQISIQCLGLFKCYLRPQDLKQIIIYMLNDEHELVREQALQTAKELKDLPLVKEDLQTLLMCLRQKRTNMRRLVYQNLSIAHLSDMSLLNVLIDKVMVTLLNYRSDKKSIYRMLLTVGRKYWKQIGPMLPGLGLTEIDEQNWKNIVYKGKMIFCYQWWKRINNKSQIKLPLHFVKHMLYISDVETYLFSESIGMQEEEYQSINFDKLVNNLHHLIRFIECQEEISQEFHRIVLLINRQILIGHTSKEVLLNKLNILGIDFKLGPEEDQLKSQLYELLQRKSENLSADVLKIVRQCIQNRQKYEQKDSSVPKNKCTVSRLQGNLVVSSKSPEFVKRLYLRCFKNFLLSREQKIEYKRVCDLQKLREDSQNCFWSVSLIRYSKVECVLTNGREIIRVLDTYVVDQK